MNKEIYRKPDGKLSTEKGFILIDCLEQVNRLLAAKYGISYFIKSYKSEKAMPLFIEVIKWSFNDGEEKEENLGYLFISELFQIIDKELINQDKVIENIPESVSPVQLYKLIKAKGFEEPEGQEELYSYLGRYSTEDEEKEYDLFMDKTGEIFELDLFWFIYVRTEERNQTS